MLQWGDWGERKESARGTMGRGKREERLPLFPSSHRSPRAFYFFDYCSVFFRDTQREPLRRREALVQNLSRLFHLVQFIKCWKILQELNSKRLY